MRLGVLGWGSLIWNPGCLAIQGEWHRGGPVLPIEFSRVSQDGRLTLVIDPENGVYLPTSFAISALTGLEEAILNLRAREECPPERIGYVVVEIGEGRSNVWPAATTRIRDWARQQGLDAVIWTDLPSNFNKKTDMPFTVSNAVDYLQTLSGTVAVHAKEYIEKAPDEIITPLRQRLRGLGWCQ